MAELKDFLIVGILGSLWIKIFEWYFWINLKFISWDILLGTFGFAQLVYLVLTSGMISWAFYLLFKDKPLSMAFIPLVWYYVKDIYNVIFAGSSVAILSRTFVEGILVAIPVGFFVYWLYEKYKR